MSWNPLDKEENNQRIMKEHKYFLPNNDNFIDVAFMKGIIGNVYCYYFETRNRTEPGRCDDIFGADHIFKMISVKDFKKPKNNQRFILDIDLDFFVRCDYETGNSELTIIPESYLKSYINLIKSLGKKKNCVGITIALEPDCCGSEENCLKICDYFSKAFDKDIVSVSRHRLRENYQTS